MLRNAPTNLPASGITASATIVPSGMAVKERSNCRPAEAKNSGTNKPSDALRIPGMISQWMRCGSPDSATPNSSAPRVPCRPIFSAPTTIRNSPPSNRPNDSSGTFTKRCRNRIAGGSTRVDSTQVTTTKPAICRSSVTSPSTLGSWCSPMVKPTTSSAATSAMATMVKIFSPIGSFRWPESASTLATSPRLDSDRMPASASASSKCRPSAKENPARSEVTSMADTSEMITDSMAATK